MELRHLRSFIAVAEELHFTRAAMRLHITTPSLSERIHELERELGVQLLLRTRRSVKLTDTGTRFLRDARDVVGHADRARLGAQQAGRGEVGRVSIGYVTSMACSGLVSKAILEFSHRRPMVVVDLTRYEAKRQLENLIAGTLDVAFLRPPQQYPVGLSGLVLRCQPLVLAMPRNHRLSRIGLVPMSRLSGEAFISPSLETELGFYADISEIGRRAGFHPQIVRRVPDFITALTLIASGLGIGLVPKSVSCIHLPGVVFRSLLEPLDPGAFAAVFRQKESAPATKAFIDLLREMATGTLDTSVRRHISANRKPQ